MDRKAASATFETKATDPGVFTARWSVFGNVDHVGDRVAKGAFAKQFAEDPHLPIIWSHRWDVPPIGETLDAFETEKGAEATGRLFVKGDESHEVARQVYAGMKSGALKKFSFAYDVETESKGEHEGKAVRELESLYPVYEWGPTLVGVNSATDLLTSPKSAETLLGIPAEALRKALDGGEKAGARNNSSDATRLQQIHDYAVENGAACAAKALQLWTPDKPTGRKSYEDIDAAAVFYIQEMISSGTNYIAGEDDPADTAEMGAVLQMLARMLADELAEIGATEQAESAAIEPQYAAQMRSLLTARPYIP